MAHDHDEHAAHDHHDDHGHDDHGHDDHGDHDDHGHAEHGPDHYRVLPTTERIDHSKNTVMGYVAFFVIVLALIGLMKAVG